MADATTRIDRWRCKFLGVRPSRVWVRRCDGGPACSVFLALLLGVLLGVLLIGQTNEAFSSESAHNPRNQGALILACWLLVLVGIAGTLLAGHGISWGWLILLGIQPLWIAYAVSTGQYGFVASALAYGVAHLNGFVRSRVSSWKTAAGKPLPRHPDTPEVADPSSTRERLGRPATPLRAGGHSLPSRRGFVAGRGLAGSGIAKWAVRVPGTLILLLVCVTHSPVRGSTSFGDRFRRHPNDSSQVQFNLGRVRGCLDRAYQVMEVHSETYRHMRGFLDETELSFDALRYFHGHDRDDDKERIAPEDLRSDPLRWFEGGWRGRWGHMSVRHVWLTLDTHVQLVLVQDNSYVQEGVNLVDRDGVICGVLVSPIGQDRLHEGRFFSATRFSSPYLKWMTPERNYYERINVDTRGGRRYHIDEEILDREQARWGVSAVYTEWKMDTSQA